MSYATTQSFCLWRKEGPFCTYFLPALQGYRVKEQFLQKASSPHFPLLHIKVTLHLVLK